jgi:hypothetical protein
MAKTYTKTQVEAKEAMLLISKADRMLANENYQRSRTHLSLEKDSPVPRSIQSPELGRVVALPQLGGLHHRYERRAA